MYYPIEPFTKLFTLRPAPMGLGWFFRAPGTTLNLRTIVWNQVTLDRPAFQCVDELKSLIQKANIFIHFDSEKKVEISISGTLSAGIFLHSKHI